jgi:hypothetical protein
MTPVAPAMIPMAAKDNTIGAVTLFILIPLFFIPIRFLLYHTQNEAVTILSSERKNLQAHPLFYAEHFKVFFSQFIPCAKLVCRTIMNTANTPISIHNYLYYRKGGTTVSIHSNARRSFYDVIYRQLGHTAYPGH